MNINVDDFHFLLKSSKKKKKKKNENENEYVSRRK
jgi:hypothetical protein